MSVLKHGRDIGRGGNDYSGGPDANRQQAIYDFTIDKFAELNQSITEKDLDSFLELPANDDEENTNIRSVA